MDKLGLQKRIFEIVNALALTDLKQTISENKHLSSVERLKLNSIVEGLKTGKRKSVGDTTNTMLIDMFESKYGARFFDNVPKVVTNPSQFSEICESIGLKVDKFSVSEDHINKFNRKYNIIKSDFPEFNLFESYTHNFYNGLPIQLLKEETEDIVGINSEPSDDQDEVIEQPQDGERVELTGDMEVYDPETQELVDADNGVYTLKSIEEGYANISKGGKIYMLPVYEYSNALVDGRLKIVKKFDINEHRQMIAESNNDLAKIKDLLYNKYGESSIELAYADIFKRKKPYYPEMRDEIYNHMETTNDKKLKETLFGSVFEASKIRPDSAYSDLGMSIKDLEKYFDGKTVTQIMHSKEDLMLVKTKGGNIVTVEKLGNNSYKVWIGTVSVKESDAVQVLSVTPANPLDADSVMEVRLEYDGNQYLFDGVDLSESATGIVFEEGDHEYDTIMPVAQSAMNSEVTNPDDTNLNEGIDSLELSNGDVTVSLYKSGGKWYEGNVIDGEEPYGWGGKTYQGYLDADDIADWLSKDYGGRWTVTLEEAVNPFDPIKKGAIGAYHGAEYYIVDLDSKYVYIQETTDAFDRPVKMGDKNSAGVTKVERSNFDKFFLPKGTYENVNEAAMESEDDLVKRFSKDFPKVKNAKELAGWLTDPNKKPGVLSKISFSIIDGTGVKSKMEMQDIISKVFAIYNESVVAGLVSESVDEMKLTSFGIPELITRLRMHANRLKELNFRSIDHAISWIKDAGEDEVEDLEADMNKLGFALESMEITEAKKKILSFSFNQDNISLDDVKDIIEKYTKDWRTSGDISETNMYVTLDEQKAKQLHKELKSYGYFYDFEMDDSAYESIDEAKEDQIKEVYSSLTDEIVGFNPMEYTDDVETMREKHYVDYLSKTMQIPSEEVAQVLGVNFGDKQNVISDDI